jgi:hypothetical protein
MQQQTNSNNEMKLSFKLETNTKDSPCLHLLPLESWVDIFAFLHRPQLAEIVPQIGDWHFATKAQFARMWPNHAWRLGYQTNNIMDE